MPDDAVRLLECLWDQTQAGSLPGPLTTLYDGGLSLESPRCYANFVSSVDGVVALKPRRNSGSIIGGRNRADRFLMGLLRAFADAVLVGAGTMRADGHGAQWTPAFIYPPAAADFAALRQQLGLAVQPRLVILTMRGDLDASEPAIQAGPIIITSPARARTLREAMPAASEVITLPAGDGIDPREVMTALRARGYARVLSEGGPTTFGELLRAHLVDELFLTLSPGLAGRDDRGDHLGLVEDAIDPAKALEPMELLSVRRSASHLFLRYRLG